MSPSEYNLTRFNLMRKALPQAPQKEEDLLQWAKDITVYLKDLELQLNGQGILRMLTEHNVPDRTKNYLLMYDQSQDEMVFIEDTQ